MAFDTSILVSIGVPELLLWLLTFAVVYGVLSQIGEKGMPKSQASRAIIAIVAGFMVLFAAPQNLLGVLTQMSSSLILIVVGLLILIVFLEIAGVKASKPYQLTDPKTGQTRTGTESVSVFEKYGREFGIVLVIITIAIFIASGGLDLLGFQNIAFSGQNVSSIIFFGIILIAIIWMISEKKD